MAKLVPKHILKTKDQIKIFPDNKIKRMLQQPNEYMNLYDFLYKIAIYREEQDNAFIFFDKENYKLYPIQATDIEIMQTKTNNLAAKCRFKTGATTILPFQDLLIIRKHFNKNELFGDNQNSLNKIIQIINTVDEGIVAAVKNGANIKGILNWKSILKDEDVERETKKFKDNYLNINNTGGIASTDPRFEFKELKQDNYIPNSPQMAQAKERIYSYFQTNENIIQSKFTEEEWNAYYETVIETFAIQLSLEFTKQIFKDTGEEENIIIFESNKLQYASIKSKIELIKELIPTGILSINEAREIFNLSPIEEGDKHLISLNYVNAKKIDKYQNIEGD